jgi:hypothetical protein
LKARLTTALMGSSILHSSGQQDASLALSSFRIGTLPWLRSALLVTSICLLSPPAWALLPPWALGALAIGLTALAWAALEACYR